MLLMSYRLQSEFLNLLHQVAVARQAGEHFPHQRGILVHVAFRHGAGAVIVMGLNLAAKLHAIQDILIAGSGEYLFQPIELVKKPGRLVFPQAQ